MRFSISAALLLIVAAVGVLAFGGFITVWDGDSGEDIFVRRIDSSASLVFVLSTVALSAAVGALWNRRFLWVVMVSAGGAALFALSIRRSVLSGAAAVNDFIAIEGGTGAIHSRIARAASGPITSVDPDIIKVGWAIGAVLLTAVAVLAGCSLFVEHRRGSALASA